MVEFERLDSILRYIAKKPRSWAGRIVVCTGYSNTEVEEALTVLEKDLGLIKGSRANVPATASGLGYTTSAIVYETSNEIIKSRLIKSLLQAEEDEELAKMAGATGTGA